ncbi:MAG TPA: sugar phosphate isomerase/epimerase [Candidatus Mediterraneibacter colneyensis]|nr:sugar phosphate isomerase/epimerase [Candidatus Mediterraneibacter colneyensis]
MNKLGIFVNFWEKNWACDLGKYIRKAGKIGYDILEFQAQALLEMDKAKMDELKKISADENVELTYSLGLDPRYDVSSADESTRLGGIEYLKNIVERVGYMDGRIISGVSYAGWGCVPKEDLSGDKSAIVSRSVDSMKKIAKTAADYGVTYCVEVVNRYEGCVLNTAAEAVDYVDAVGADNVGILLDTYHMNIEEDSFSDAIHTAGDKLKGVHFGDNNRRCPGRGHIDFDEIAAALKDIGYKDQIVSELFVAKGGEVGRDICVWRNLEKDVSENCLDAEAAHMLEFERELLARHGMA